MSFEPTLRDAVEEEAEADHRPASQMVRELMSDYIERKRRERKYEGFLRRKVQVARSSVRIGRGRPNEDVEAEFAARRAKAAGRACGSFGRRKPNKTARR